MSGMRRWSAVVSVVALLGLSMPATAMAVPADERDVFVATTDGSAYGLLGTLTTTAPEVAITFLGSLAEFDLAPDGVTVTAADYDAVSGNVVVLVSAEQEDGGFLCGVVWVAGSTGAPVGTPIPFVDGDSGDPWVFDTECTSLDVITDQFLSGSAQESIESFLPAMTSDAFTPAGNPLSGAFIGLADGQLFAITLSTGIVSLAGSITIPTGEPLEALTLMSYGDGPSRFVFIAVAYGDDIAAWAGGFGEMLLPEPAVGTIVGLDLDADGTLWFTWQFEGATGLTAVTPPINPFVTSAAVSSSDVSPASLTPVAGEVLSVFSLTLNSANVVAEAVTVVPAGFGTVDAGNELAETGADSGIVATLAIIAGVLGGLGLVLIVVRLVLRRRSTVGQSSDEHPVP